MLTKFHAVFLLYKLLCDLSPASFSLIEILSLDILIFQQLILHLFGN